MSIKVVGRDGLVQAQGSARDVLALLSLLVDAKVERITATVLDGRASIVWALQQ